MNCPPFLRIEFSLRILVLCTWMVRKLGVGVAGFGNHAALCGINLALIFLPSPARSSI